MTEFADKYVEQMQRAINALDEKLFPAQAMEDFRVSAEADIAAGRNRCQRTGEPTMLRIWPVGAWISEHDADVMWKTGGFPAGMMVFDMSIYPRRSDSLDNPSDL